MKTKLVVLMALAGAVCGGQADETTSVDSAQTLGIIKVDRVDKSEIVVGVPWGKANADGTLVNVSVADLFATGMADGDELWVWNGSAYDTWKWQDGKWTAAIEGKTGASGPNPESVTLERGTAVWLKRKDGVKGGYSLIGLSSDSCETAVNAGEPARPSLTLMVNPFPENVDAAKFTGCADGDQLQLLNANGTTIYTYKSESGKWGYDAAVKKSITLPNGKTRDYTVFERQDLSELIIPAGTGFWYIGRGEDASINWKNAKQNQNN